MSLHNLRAGLSSGRSCNSLNSPAAPRTRIRQRYAFPPDSGPVVCGGSSPTRGRPTPTPSRAQGRRQRETPYTRPGPTGLTCSAPVESGDLACDGTGAHSSPMTEASVRAAKTARSSSRSSASPGCTQQVSPLAIGHGRDSSAASPAPGFNASSTSSIVMSSVRLASAYPPNRPRVELTSSASVSAVRTFRACSGGMPSASETSTDDVTCPVSLRLK